MTLSINNFGSGYNSPIPYPDFHSKGPALCTQLDSELYFPEGSSAHQSQNTAAILKLCGECPYKTECLEWALVNREDGIWGGTTNVMRSKIRGGVRSRSEKIDTRPRASGPEKSTRKWQHWQPPASFDLTSATSII